MNSIDFETLLIIIFVLVDDWYQLEGKALRGNLPGAKPTMSDSEILTLALAMDYLPFPGESQFITDSSASWLILPHSSHVYQFTLSLLIINHLN